MRRLVFNLTESDQVFSIAGKPVTTGFGDRHDMDRSDLFQSLFPIPKDCRTQDHQTRAALANLSDLTAHQWSVDHQLPTAGLECLSHTCFVCPFLCEAHRDLTVGSRRQESLHLKMANSCIDSNTRSAVPIMFYLGCIA